MRAANPYVDAGAATYVERAPARIDGAASEAVVDVANVRAAGAIRATQERLTPASLPGTSIPVFSSTRSFGAVIGLSSADSGGLGLVREKHFFRSFTRG